MVFLTPLELEKFSKGNFIGTMEKINKNKFFPKFEELGKENYVKNSFQFSPENYPLVRSCCHSFIFNEFFIFGKVK